MKHSAIAACAALFTLIAAPAQAGPAAESELAPPATSVPSTGWPYDGMIEITNTAGTGCSVAKGDIYFSVYRPKYDSTDTKSAGLTVNGKRNGFVMVDKSTGQKFSGSGNYDVSGISSRGYPYTQTNAGSYALTVKFDTNVHTTAKTVIISGTISNFWTDTGCTATVTGVYQRRAN